MKLINNTYPTLYYYIPSNKTYGLLNFGQQIETLDSVLSFNNKEEWKTHINNELGTDTWLNDSLKLQLEDNNKYIDSGYLTNFNFRLDVNDATDNMLNELLTCGKDPINIRARSGDTYTISRSDLINIITQYQIDKPLYLTIVEK